MKEEASNKKKIKINNSNLKISPQDEISTMKVLCYPTQAMCIWSTEVYIWSTEVYIWSTEVYIWLWYNNNLTLHNLGVY